MYGSIKDSQQVLCPNEEGLLMNAGPGKTLCDILQPSKGQEHLCGIFNLHLEFSFTFQALAFDVTGFVVCLVLLLFQAWKLIKNQSTPLSYANSQGMNYLTVWAMGFQREASVMSSPVPFQKHTFMWLLHFACIRYVFFLGERLPYKELFLKL